MADDTPSPTAPPPTAWPCLSYADPLAAIKFLVDAFGFEERLVVPGEGDREVAHAELRWPPGGGVMLGSPNPELGDGIGVVYCVTDEPDALLAKATAAGAEVVRGIEDTDYGSRGFTVRDPEGHSWSFGTYRGT